MSIRICPTCREYVGFSEYPHFSLVDPCIGYLPGVVAACCGHGIRRVAVGVIRRNADGVTERGMFSLTGCYVYFEDGPTLYGNAARAAMQMLGGNPPRIPPAYWPAPDWDRPKVFVP